MVVNLTAWKILLICAGEVLAFGLISYFLSFVVMRRMEERRKKGMKEKRTQFFPVSSKKFYLIRTGEQKEEYRTLSLHYHLTFKRIFGACVNGRGQLEDENGTEIEETQKEWVAFRKGYYNRAPVIYAQVSLSVDIGLPEWGAIEGERYYVLKIWKVQEDKPW